MESTAGSDSPNYELEDAVPKPSSPKRNRRSVQKRVVTVPISDAEGSRSKSGGEGAPPSDSWAWRKYGQKPIKGSPYPRGYYRCSSSKGCPARKQVERSRVDPTTIVVTYACEHNHPWPVSKGRSQSSSKAPADPVRFGPAAGLPEPEERYSDLMITPEDYRWFSDVASNSSGSPPPDLLVGPMAADVATFMEECDELAGGEEEEEDSLFAGLGELPECSLVLRRGATAARGEERRRCSLAASR